MLNVTAARQHVADMRAQYMADGRKGSAAHRRYLEADAAWSAAVRYATSFPAAAGDIVTQGHAGETVPWCPRCGE